MNSYMMLLLILCGVFCTAEWKLIYDRFDEPLIDSQNTGWDFRKSCTPGSSSCSSSIISCSENENTMLRMSANCRSMNKDFNHLTPHFQLKFIFDLYILGSRSSTSFTVLTYADSIEIYYFSYNSGIAIYNNKVMCQKNGDNNFLYKTRVETFNHDASSVNLRFCTTITDNDCFNGIRNIQLYQNSCNAKCKKCSSESYCTECYDDIVPIGGICLDCTHNTLFIDITKPDCQQECDSDKVADSQNICQTDPSIINQPKIDISIYNKYFDSTSFASYEGWKLIADPIQYSLLSEDRVIYTGEQYYAGAFGANDAMQLELNFVNTVQYIRLRVTFDFYLTEEGASIYILWNDVPIDLIYRQADDIYSQTSTIILKVLDQVHKKVRIEKLFTNTLVNSKLAFKGNMRVDEFQRWAFRDVFIDYGVCEKNCDLCTSATKCQTCSGSRKNHKGKCLNSCPLYSTKSGAICNDFDDDLEYSKYYIKAFYDTSTTDIEASTVLGTFQPIDSNNLISGGAVFSYLPYKRVFGGSFVWFNARVFRNITNIKPHYQYKLKMEIILGEREGNFYYNFTGGSNSQIIETGVNLPTPTNQSNIWGQSRIEYQYSIDEVIPHSLDYLNFEMRYDCQQGNPQDGFAAISNFYLIFYYCVPFCPQCTGPNFEDCIWGSSYDSTTMQQTTHGGPITCKDHYYLFTDESTISHSCLPCVANCDACTSATLCITCFTDFYLMNGRCECMAGTYHSSTITCSVCDDHCLTCKGPNNNNCLTCHDRQYIMLNKNICICKPHYSLQIDGSCQPICGDMVVVPGEECDDGNLVEYDGCHQCKFQCQLNCQTCLFGKCTICSSGFYLNLQINHCQSKCGDFIVSGVEQCEDGNLVPYDGCYQCKFQCQNECIDCRKGICFACQSGFKLNLLNSSCEFNYLNQITGNFLQVLQNHNLIDQCLIYLDGICLQCNNEQGWQQNIFGFCETICGDNILVPSVEQCDDGNDIQYDGCNKCHFNCQAVCTQCISNICFECDTSGWYLNSTICHPICGDSIILSYEQCDDGNDEMYDGCYECKLQCEEKCNQCVDGQCFGCIVGWDINSLRICETICGDSIIIKPQEDCDDGNLEPYDGCFECRFQCEKLCTTCIEGVCYECDILGWQINENHKCEPICNDGLVMGLEECDDMNLIPYDGCNNCKFQCHQYCLQCVDGVCLKCDYGRYPNLSQCKSFCGDGQKIEFEECDDDNLNDVDGCSKECEIEANWVCITKNYEASTCFSSKIPLLELSLLDETSIEMQIVSLKFDIEMQRISIKDIKPQFSFRIFDLEDIQYQIILSPITPLTNNAQFVEYDIQIYFNISVYRPMLIVEITNITNQYQQTFKSLEGRIYLRDSEVITEGEKQSTRNAKSFSQIVIYTMGGTVAIAILTGSLELVWNLLDMLQLLSYIKYINIAFPLNLDTYFEIFKLITISPLVQYLGVDDILTILNGGVVPFIETKNKFKDDQINAYFLGNFLSFLLCFILAYSNYFFSKIMSTLLYKLGPWVLSMSNLAFLKIVHKAIKYFRKNAQKFYYSIFIRMFLANYYEIMFAACIQLNNLNWENTNMAVNSALSIMTVVGEAYFIYNIAFKLYSFTKNNTVSNKRKYDSIFEGVKENKANFWVMQLNSILLLKKFIFMVIIVNFQDEGTIQTIFLSISSAIYLAYLIKTKPFDSKSEFIKQIINEFVISFNTLTFLIYKYKQPLQLSYSQVMILGWLHITLFSVTLCSTLLIDIYHQISIIWNKLKLNQQQKLIKNDSGADKQQLEQQKSFQGQCTLCNQQFNQFNIQLEQDCKIHKIGVCCQKFQVGCPQCEQQPDSDIKIKKFIKQQDNKYFNQKTEIISENQSVREADLFQRPHSILQNYSSKFSYSKRINQRNASVNHSIVNDLQ